MSAPPRIHPFEAAALAVLFAAAISLPIIKQRFVGEMDTSSIENRMAAMKPVFAGFGKRSLKLQLQKFDAWYNDHFGFRYQLVNLGSRINIKWFGISQHAMIGKNQWLYLKLDPDPPLFTQSLSNPDLAKWKNYLEHRKLWLAAMGIKYLFVVPPEKDSIYPEFLPSTCRLPPKELPVDQLVRYLRETHSSVDILSLREPLLAAKPREQEPLYYKQDTHWNTLGGFYGYEAIIHHLAREFPSLKAKARADYRLTIERDRNKRDIAILAGAMDFPALSGPVLQPLFPESVQRVELQVPGFASPPPMTPPFMTQARNPGNQPRAVMMRDSFTIALAPYLSESFSSITYFWSTGSKENEKAMADYVLKEKPDIFIEERVQRFIRAVPDESLMFGGTDNNASGTENP